MKSSSSVSSPFSPRASRAASSARLIMSCRSSSVRLLGGLLTWINHSMVSKILFLGPQVFRGIEKGGQIAGKDFLYI